METTLAKIMDWVLNEEPFDLDAGIIHMNSTALGAGAQKAQKIIFISEAHEKLKEVRYQDVYHKALCYCLCISVILCLCEIKEAYKSVFDEMTNSYFCYKMMRVSKVLFPLTDIRIAPLLRKSTLRSGRRRADIHRMSCAPQIYT